MSKYILDFLKIILKLLQMAFGKDLIRLRKASNLSVREFAENTNITADRIRKWEQRDLNPRSEDTKKIEAYYGMPISKLSSLDKFPKVPIVPRGGIIKKTITKHLTDTERRLLKLECAIDVVLKTVEGLAASASKTEVSLVSYQMQQAIQGEFEHRLSGDE